MEGPTLYTPHLRIEIIYDSKALRGGNKGRHGREGGSCMRRARFTFSLHAQQQYSTLPTYSVTTRNES